MGRIEDGLKPPVGRRFPPRLSRRAFSGLLTAGAAGLTLGIAGFLRPLRVLLGRIEPPSLEDAPAAALDARTLHTLLAATRAVVNEPIAEAHYADFFRWRAEHLRGHRALYERFCATIDRTARQDEGREFAGCSVLVQRRVLRPAFQVRAAAASARALGGAGREWLLYDRHIVQEILAVFARTDIWILLGYEAWPGTPRGLERYREAPRRKA